MRKSSSRDENPGLGGGPAGSGAWTLCRHADVLRAALDPETFSSAASRYLNVPNGMDGDEHARFRALIDRYLEPRVVSLLEPRFRRLAANLAANLPEGKPIEAVGEIGARFAVRAQSAWLGWPAGLEDTLLRWMQSNREATRSKDRGRMAEVAERFDCIIRSLIESRREADPATDAESGDVDPMTQLLADRIDDRPLRDEEIVSILRNWTAGDLGSIAACIGVIVHRLAVDRQLQVRWRSGEVAINRLEAEINEVLRIDDPFTYNRRVVTRRVEIGGQVMEAGEQVLLNWSAANRDPRVVRDPDAFRPVKNAPHNVVYGIGPHHCPGRQLATLELRVMVEELLAATSAIELAPGTEPIRDLPPFGGYSALPVTLRI